MSNVTISPNMNLPIPVVGTDPGPDWATNIVACLNIIDAHAHVPNTSGVQITPSGINITADLPFNGNNGTLFRSVRFSTQLSPIALGADIDCVYVSGVDLYYNDGNGNQIRITQSGSVTGSTGTITGLPSGTASASYAGGTFTFQKATNTPATMSVGRVVIGQEVVSGFAVTLTANASQASNFGFTFPAALPATPAYLTSDASGNLSYNTGVLGAVIAKRTDNATTSTPINSLTVAGLSFYRFTGAAALTLNGFNPGTDGQYMTIANATGFTMTIVNQSGSAIANGQFFCAGVANLSVRSSGGVLCQYDAASGAWRVLTP